MKRLTTPGCIALLLACNYFLFQVEPFADEYEANHPLPSHGLSVGSFADSWETCDKENAPEAIVIEEPAFIDVVFLIRIIAVPFTPAATPLHQIRDKSPPLFA